MIEIIKTDDHQSCFNQFLSDQPDNGNVMVVLGLNYIEKVLYQHNLSIKTVRQDLDGTLSVTFDSGSRLSISDKEESFSRFMDRHCGMQYGKVLVVGLENFTKQEFFYLCARLRPISGVEPKMVATLTEGVSGWYDHLVECEGEAHWSIQTDGTLIQHDQSEDYTMKTIVK